MHHLTRHRRHLLSLAAAAVAAAAALSAHAALPTAGPMHVNRPAPATAEHARSASPLAAAPPRTGNPRPIFDATTFPLRLAAASEPMSTPPARGMPQRGRLAVATQAQAPPAVATPAGPALPNAAAGCGTFDVPCKVGAAIDDWFRKLVRSAVNPVIEALGTSLLASPRVDQMPRVRQLWSASATIANACLVLLVMAAGLMLMGHGSVQTTYTAKDVAPRLVVAVVAANTSLEFIGQAITFANGLSGALMGQGVPVDEAAQRLKSLLGEVLLVSVTGRSPLFVVLIAMIAVALALGLIAIYVIRTMALTLLTASAPLALICHALPHTDGLARLWWRALTGVLAIQAAQALVTITALQVFFTSSPILFGHNRGKGLFDLLLVICLLYVLFRIPSWIWRLVLRGHHSSPLARIIRYAIGITLARRMFGRGRPGPAGSGPNGRPPRPPRIPPGPTQPPPIPPPARPPRGTQPWLPFSWPSPGGQQPRLPFTLPPGPARPRWTQMRLPQAARGPGPGRPPGEHRQRPIQIRYEQPQPPLRTPPQHHRPKPPLDVPQRGTTQPGRSPRAARQQAGMRPTAEPQTRARQRPTNKDAAPADRPSRVAWPRRQRWDDHKPGGDR